MASDDSVVETIDVTTPGAVVISGGEVTIVRSVVLANLTDYYVNIASGAFTDLSGNAYAGTSGDTGWSFTTGATLPFSAGDVIKLDVSDNGDSAGIKTGDWNTIVSFPGTIASGSVIRHGDGAAVDNLTIASSLPNGGGSGQVGAIGTTAWTGLGSDPYYNSLSYTDFIWNSGNSMTVTFGGLDAALTYNVRFYVLLTEGAADLDFTVTDGAGVISRTGLGRSDLFDAVPLSSDAIFEGVSADGSGNIAVNVSSANAVNIEAVVLEAIPEPSSSTLLGLGLAGVLFRRRRSS